MRAVRDANLSDLSGALLTAIYYRNVTEISALFDEHPELSDRFRELVKDHSDVLANLLQGQDATVSPTAVADVIDYLEDLKAIIQHYVAVQYKFYYTGHREWLLAERSCHNH